MRKLAFLFPRIRIPELIRMLRYAALGAIMAGYYGAIHDQLSFTISPEYFTCFKFDQFSWADLGWSPRAFAAVVGWLASWWVGLFAAWFVARVRVPREPTETVRRDLWIAISGIFGIAIMGGGLGLGYGHWLASTQDLAAWSDWKYMGVTDLPNFVRVGWLHNGSYLGALLGFVAALIWVKMRSRKKGPVLARPS